MPLPFGGGGGALAPCRGGSTTSGGALGPGCAGGNSEGLGHMPVPFSWGGSMPDSCPVRSGQRWLRNSFIPPHTKKMQRAEVGPTIIITTTAAAARAATAKQQQQQTQQQQQQQQQQLQQPFRLILSGWGIYVLAQVPCPVSHHNHVLSTPMCWPMCFLDPHLARPVVQHVP